MQDARVRWALAAVGLLVFGGSGMALYARRRPDAPSVVITTSAPPTVPHSAAAPASEPPAHHGRQAVPRVYVHVAGAVRRPSLYALPAGSRIMQAVQAAGGPAAKADLDAINLAEKVRDGEKIYVPVKQAQPLLAAPPGNIIGHASVLPSGDAASPVMATSQAAASPTTGGNRHAARGEAAKAGKLTNPSQGQVNLNTADAAQLQRLPGVGPAMSARILAYRTQAHGFHSIDEIQEVGGIGPKKFAKIAPLVKLD